MAVDNFPFPLTSCIHRRGIPPDDDRVYIAMVDHIIGQNRHVTEPLDRRAKHLVRIDLDLASTRIQEFLHCCKAIDAPFAARVKVCNVWSVCFKEALGITFAPAVKCRALQCTNHTTLELRPDSRRGKECTHEQRSGGHKICFSHSFCPSSQSQERLPERCGIDRETDRVFPTEA